MVAECHGAQALDARVRTLAPYRAIHRARRRARHAVVRAQLDLPGGAQALRAVFPGQRRALQDARRDLGYVRVRFPQALCIHDHAVVEDGAWHDMRSCWFNSLYTRVIASHSIELTSAYLDRKVARALANARIGKATLRQKEDLAALIHLCGAGAGEYYARRGLRLIAHQRCGDHDVRAYLNRVQGMKTVF